MFFTALARFVRGPLFRNELSKTFTLALPLMLGELSSMMMGLAGTMMVGRLGETALAASGVAGVIYVIAMLIVWGSIRMIPTPVAEAHELRDAEKVRTLVGSGLLLSLLLTAAAGILLWAGIANFDLLKQDPEVSVLAVGYLKIVMFSLPMMVFFAVIVNYADAFSLVRLTMIVSFAGLLLDVALNWLLIFGHFGLPALGINAIAVNMGITHTFMTLLLLGAMWRRADLRYFQQIKTTFEAVWAQTKAFLSSGIPSALQIMVEFAAFGGGTVIIGQISKTEQAAHQIAINLISVTYVTIMGVSTAGMIRVGQAMAYQSRVRIWMAGIATIVLAMSIMLAPTLAFLLFSNEIVRLYVDDLHVIQVAATLVFFAGVFQLADAAQASGISLLRALNDIKVPSLISFVAFWLIGIPFGYWLAVPMGWNAKGIWIGYVVALIVQAVWFVGRFFVLVDRRRRQ